MKIYHIVPSHEWQGLAADRYEASSLLSEGFIHCSFAEQVDNVLARYFGNEQAVMILEIDPARLVSKLIVEPSTGGESYPHVYGPINLDAVVSTERRSKDVDTGKF
jgi:uncharacterized protein (DUF952 family)